METFDVQLTAGRVLGHAPARSPSGRSAATIDIAQDLLLRHLRLSGVLDLLVFKGGTALRKLYAGAAGRFSTDLDFSVRSLDDDPATVIAMLAEAIDGIKLGPLRYHVVEHRGRFHITYESSIPALHMTKELQSKIDVGPPPWLEPSVKHWVPVPIHSRYGGPLPDLLCMRLEENIAEKIARLNRRTLARDAYDLVWISSTPGHNLDRALIRRLAVLKCWVDLHGLTTATSSWTPLPQARPFDTQRWLQPRRQRDFDDENIGLLTAPPPDLDTLGNELANRYQWLADLDEDERIVANGAAADRTTVLRMLADLDGQRLNGLTW